MGQRRWRAGIDVGKAGIGASGIEIDDSTDNPFDAVPIGILNSCIIMHDGALDPNNIKSNLSRKAVSGVARRVRRMRKTKRRRMKKLERLLSGYGWPTSQDENYKVLRRDLANALDRGLKLKAYLPWIVRRNLVEGYIENESDRKLMLSIAIMHIANHRGWRNSYNSIATLRELSAAPSDKYKEYLEKVAVWWHENKPEHIAEKLPGVEVEKTIIQGDKETVKYKVTGIDKYLENRGWETIPQILFLSEEGCLGATERIRKEALDPVVNVHIGKLHQSDNYHELKTILDTQRVPIEQQNEILDAVFYVVHPKQTGAAAKLAGADPLQPQYTRAQKCNIAFQKYRILDTLSNLRIRDNVIERALTPEEKRVLFDWLTSKEVSKKPDLLTWVDVVEKLGINPNDLRGVGKLSADGDPVSAKHPPYLESDSALLEKMKAKDDTALLEWYFQSDANKEALLRFMSSAGCLDTDLSEIDKSADGELEELLATGTVKMETIERLEKVELPTGRAAYSVNTLRKLNEEMLEGSDLTEARCKLFGIPTDWKPPASALGTPTGQPVVDRNIKAVAAWMKKMVELYGPPETVSIEHVREGFKSPKTIKKITDDNNKRYRYNRQLLNDAGTTKYSQILKIKALQRQNSQCAYCGKTITFNTAEMDHIVPRKSIGASNRMHNLVAVCSDCNKSKNRKPFYIWAGKEKYGEVVTRVNQWNQDPTMSDDEFKAYTKDVISRLQLVDCDDDIEAASMESIGWAANELARQIEGYLKPYWTDDFHTPGNEPYNLKKRVYVYRGKLTAIARKASGIEKKLPWHGGANQKTRLDRRHHFVDATVVAMMRPAVVKVLAEREEARRAERIYGTGAREWVNYEGRGENTAKYREWKDNMCLLAEYMKDAMCGDEIPIVRLKRLRKGVGKAHKDTINPLSYKRLSEAFSTNEIDRVSSKAVYEALVGLDDYNEKYGLPINETRIIQADGNNYGPHSRIGIMGEAGGSTFCIPVNNGYAEAGKSVHHVRIYRVARKNKKGKVSEFKLYQLRVHQQDLVKCNHDDLFSVELKQSDYSVRMANTKLRKALKDGSAEYLGWYVSGDEMRIEEIVGLKEDDSLVILKRYFPEITAFEITGAPKPEKITIKPLALSIEGLPMIDWSNDEKIAQNREEILLRIYGTCDITQREDAAIRSLLTVGVTKSISTIAAMEPMIVRRDMLGRERWNSKNMPSCWSMH